MTGEDKSRMDSRLEDSLARETRLSRRNLIVASGFSVAAAKAGLIPTKISAFGIELSSINQKNYALIVGAATLYFMVSFVIYALADFMSWYQQSVQNRLLFLVQARRAGISWFPYYLSGFIAWLKIGLEVVVPVLISSYAVHTIYEYVQKI